MGAIRRIASVAKSLAYGAIAKWTGGALLALLLAATGAKTVTDLLAKVPWSAIGLVGAAFLGFFLGGLLLEIRAVGRSEKLVHWLYRSARADDLDRVEWAFSVFMPNEAAMDKRMTPILEGTVLSKRLSKTDNITGLLQIDEDSAACWVACDRNSLTFRNARPEKKIVLRALPLGVVGKELLFLHWRGSQSEVSG